MFVLFLLWDVCIVVCVCLNVWNLGFVEQFGYACFWMFGIGDVRIVAC